MLINVAAVPKKKRGLGGPASALKAKTDYCKTCHGLDGQGFRGSFPMPRLAGQQPEYLANQLQAFIDRRRTNPVMFNVAHVLDPATLKALAAYFQSSVPNPLGGGAASKALVPEGKKIYRGRRAERQCSTVRIVSWSPRQGADAFPRLAGQLPDYIYPETDRLGQGAGSKKDQPDNSAIMQPIAHDLTETQIKAVAAYVSQLN